MSIEAANIKKLWIENDKYRVECVMNSQHHLLCVLEADQKKPSKKRQKPKKK